MEEKNNKILLIADLPPGEVIPVIQESIGICRFEYTLEALVRAEAAPVIKRILPALQLTDLEKIDCDYEIEGIYAVLAAVTQDLNARLALGLQDKNSARIILQSLWLGIPVFMDFSIPRSLKGRPCASKNLKQLYEKYKEDVKKLGVKEILPGEYIAAIRKEALEKNKTASEEPEKAFVQQTGRIFITGKDILKAADEKLELEIPKNAVVTAYARDMAGKRGLTLKRKGEQY